MSRLPSRPRAPRFRGGRVDAGRLAARVASFAARRAMLVIVVVSVLCIASVLLALRLDPSAATDTLVDRDDGAAVATDRLHREFGGDPIAVLVRGRSGTQKCEPECRLPDLLLTADLARIAALEGCLSGNVPRGARPLAPACAELGRRRPVDVVYGPGTFINESVRQVSSRFEDQRRKRATQAAQAARAAREVAKARGLGQADQNRLARQARQLVYAQYARDALRLALNYGLSSLPSVNNPEFVLRLVFEPSLGAGVPKPRFAYLFPSERSALIQARLRAGLSKSERERAIDLVRDAVASPRFRLERGEYLVSGPPVVEAAVASRIPGALVFMLVATALVMAATLALSSRSRPRLLPLAPAFAAVALTLGGMSLAGVSLTIASIAVVPVVCGLAAGYAIHFQARFDEARAGAPGPDAVAAAAAGAPVIGTAALAVAAGCLALLASPVPMVRSFGALVAVGIVLSLACTLTVGSALLGGGLRRPGWGTRRLHGPARMAMLLKRGRDGAASRVGWAWRGCFGLAIRRPRRVLAIALLAAVAGWLVVGRTDVVSDLQRLAPGDLSAVEDASTLQRESGVSGDVNVVVRADDVTSPAVIRWMSDYQERVLRRHGYSEKRKCRQADLCPGQSVTNLFGSGRAESPRRIAALLAALPPYFSRSVISNDRRTATIAFGVRAMPLDEQKELVDDLRAQLDPPAGVRAELAGAPVLASDANAELESHRWLLTVAALALVLVVLLALYRPAGQVIAPLVPVVLASGWSALVVFALQIALNPLSVALGALVIAICAGMAVILTARYRLERGAGHPPAAALGRAYEREGRPVLAAAAAVIAAFATLILSDMRMLRDFGFVAAVDLAVVVVGVAVVLPAALVWIEQWQLARAIGGLPRRARRGTPVGARSARGGR